MPYILSSAHSNLPNSIAQDTVMDFSRSIFGSAFKDIERLLKAFKNGEIENRYFACDLDWFNRDHTFQEKNEKYIELAAEYGAQAIQKCLINPLFLRDGINIEEIDAFFFISSTGISTPSVDAIIMNMLPFSPHTKRIPIWGLGCAGGASGLSRAYEYCKAFPEAKALVLTVELCSLTFQKNDVSKSNLIGTSLFADGTACALVCGDESGGREVSLLPAVPEILGTQSTLMPQSLDVMGWEMKNEGLHVVFSRDIPAIIKNWLKPNVEEFLSGSKTELQDISHFIAHPGGKKVISAYKESLDFTEEMTETSMDILKKFGNMSSATILYVLEKFMEKQIPKGEKGLAAALGPGFSSELLLMRWQ
ncbi:15-methylpalmitoyl-4-hydroxy-2-pyrone synthase [Bacillus sp. OV322]|uniref:type III polyketide synthase n=1 Tax=Bacillus sp. OV322 TaxID=1882764 RepID=UPI0008E8B93F|nr:3-oxoacyl-[acyl-carrier-protein] synthase III C-terminal domain-containing protein [Bacillus sp. OV322]SFC46363.1 15-methylpalmitoyl-4-hydroxy-2-pyrone synthase [Bacillus sp. OV322]